MFVLRNFGKAFTQIRAVFDFSFQKQCDFAKEFQVGHDSFCPM